MNTIKPGAASELNDAEVLFLKMPLLHSESLEVHEWNVAARWATVPCASS